VIITVLNDGTIISIAYDRVTVSQKPEKWRLDIIFMISTLLGGIACISSLILLLLCLENMDGNSDFFAAFGIDSFGYGELMTIIYFKVSLSDYLTVFAARTHSWWWTRKPGRALMIAAVFATIVSTIFSAFWFMNVSTGGNESIPNMVPVSAGMILFVWIYDLVWFEVQDVCKVLFLRMLQKYFENSDTENKIYHGQFLNDSFLKFGNEGGHRKSSIVNKGSMAAANRPTH
jgi:H+-transporting ATPase